jgi:hypothetical protein
VLRTVLVIVGGVVLPGVSLVLNEAFHVVDLGPVGTGAILLAMVSALGHLVWSWRRPEPPASSAWRVLLLGGSLVGVLTWGYLALLFVPLVPLSVIALLWMGLGLCGLCPYGALAIAVIHTVRDVRALSERFRRRAVIAFALAMLVLPVAVVGVVGLYHHRRRQEIGRALQRVAAFAPWSTERMRAISSLGGREEQLVETYLVAEKQADRALIAEVYRRLADRTLNRSVEEKARGQHALIRPLGFVRGIPVFGRDPWRF